MENTLLKEFIQRQEDNNHEQNKKIDKIVRALYGEEDNDTPGLVERVKAAESTLKKHDNIHKKIGWTVAGGIAAIEFGWLAFKEFFVTK